MSAPVDPDLLALVREVLAEELARRRAPEGKGERRPAGPEPREERVRVRDDAELAAFARRVLALAGDREARRAFEEGRLVFRLDGAPAAGAGRAPLSEAAPAADAAAHAETVVHGLFSERQAERLPRGTTRVRLGRHARVTPLARDRLRRRGIAIERMER